jgi:hypothetical protein
MDQSGSDQELPRYTPDDPRIIGDFLCKTLIDNTQTNLVASLYVDAPQVAVKSRHHDTSLYASLSTNTNPSRPPFRRRLIDDFGKAVILSTHAFYDRYHFMRSFWQIKDDFNLFGRRKIIEGIHLYGTCGRATRENNR